MTGSTNHREVTEALRERTLVRAEGAGQWYSTCLPRVRPWGQPPLMEEEEEEEKEGEEAKEEIQNLMMVDSQPAVTPAAGSQPSVFKFFNSYLLRSELIMKGSKALNEPQKQSMAAPVHTLVKGSEEVRRNPRKLWLDVLSVPAVE